MKFFSKFSNHRIVLKPGLPGEPLLGRAPQAGIYVKFENGVADVKDQEVIDLLMANRNFGRTFIMEKENAITQDPYKYQRRDMEPEHDITEIQFGHVGKNLNPKPKLVMNREQKAAVFEMAKEMARSIAPELAKEMLLNMAAERKEADKAIEIEEEAPITPKAPATKAKK